VHTSAYVSIRQHASYIAITSQGSLKQLINTTWLPVSEAEEQSLVKQYVRKSFSEKAALGSEDDAPPARHAKDVDVLGLDVSPQAVH
jgi:hypothetical protein